MLYSGGLDELHKKPKKKTTTALTHLPPHNYPDWAWQLKNLRVPDDQTMTNELAIHGLYTGSEIPNTGEGLFTKKKIQKSNLLF